MSCTTDQREYSSSFGPSHDEETLPPLRADGPSVWVGFIEDLPVIGTVKEAVELVLAVYEGNQSVVKLKEEAIKTSLCAPPQDSLQEPMRKTETSAASEGQTGSAGLQDITAVRLGYIAEYIQNAMKGKKGQQRGKQTKPEDKVETLRKITDKVQEIIRLIKPDFAFREPLKEELRRSKRGEHVFNNDILKFHKEILKDFLNKMQHKFSLNQDDIDTLINELGNHSLDKNTVCEISTKMVVHFDEEEFYVNSNAVVYGAYCAELRKVLFLMLNPNIEISGNVSKVNYIIDLMNEKEVYVDHFAKEKWMKQDRSNRREPSRMERFDLVKGNVADMYKHQRGVQWCAEIKNRLSGLVGQ
ncbi:uncharacterized protein LOC143487796 [Brachyhypopomus gauderio]|uniref:uncharacterized protein LOC143487796 n=1 Tax=Brachyhypopomus gauderio TaxID=698409 RepID=UPI004041CDF2